MNSLFEEVQGDLVVQATRSRDDRAVDSAQQWTMFGVDGNVQLCRHRGACRWGRIDDTDQLDFVHLPKQAGMYPAEVSNANYGEAQLAHAAALRWSRPRPFRPPC